MAFVGMVLLLAGSCTTASDTGPVTTSAPSSGSANESDSTTVGRTAGPDPSNADKGSTDAGELTNSGGEVDAALAEIEEAARPLALVVGIEQPEGSGSVRVRSDSYRRHCPLEDVSVTALVDTDELTFGLEIQRHVILFPTHDEARAFYDDLAATEIGCVSRLVTGNAVTTTTIDNVQAFPLPDDTKAIQLTATNEVGSVVSDGQSQPVRSIHAIAHDGRVVVTVTAARDTETLVGSDVFAPLLVDGLQLAQLALS